MTASGEGEPSPMVTMIDHIEIVAQHVEEYVAMFRVLGFQALTGTKPKATH